MSNKELAKILEKEYKEYFLSKAEATPNSGFAYHSEVTKFIDWLRDK